MQGLIAQAGDLRLAFFDVAKNNGPGRAGRLTSGAHSAIADRTIFPLARYLAGADAPHTIGAFLHHAAAANGYPRVAHHAEAFGRKVGELHKIEAPPLV